MFQGFFHAVMCGKSRRRQFFHFQHPSGHRKAGLFDTVPFFYALIRVSMYTAKRKEVWGHAAHRFLYLFFVIR